MEIHQFSCLRRWNKLADDSFGIGLVYVEIMMLIKGSYHSATHMDSKHSEDYVSYGPHVNPIL